VAFPTRRTAKVNTSLGRPVKQMGAFANRCTVMYRMGIKGTEYLNFFARIIHLKAFDRLKYPPGGPHFIYGNKLPLPAAIGRWALHRDLSRQKQ
jgi:hypothetical protein